MAKTITLRMVEHSSYSIPLVSGSTVGGLLASFGWVPKNKNSPARLRPSKTLK